MAIILDKYAIKEVADVMFYELDSKGAPSAPVLYLDTLKTSTLSQSSETVDARGGKGNVKLLSWDTNKELTLEITDAVFSAKSLQIMFGGDMSVTKDKQEVLKTLKAKEMTLVTKSGSNFLKFKLNGTEYYISTSLVTAFSYNDSKEAGTDTVTFGGNERKLGKEVSNPVAVANVLSWGDYYGAYDDKPASVLQEIEFVTFDLLDCTASPEPRGNDNGVIKKGMTINITAKFDSNTYYITGDTYARNVASGQDEFLQFIIPKGKVSAEDVSLTMEADGDPAEFAMTVQCLKSEAPGNPMVQLVKYALSDGTGGSTADGRNKGVASVLDTFESDNNHASWKDPASKVAANASQIIGQ